MLRQIRERDFARVAELSEDFGISEVTVRSDLALLERRGDVRRVHGGAVPEIRRLRRERPFEQEAEAMAAEKAAIGHRAAQLVEPGNTVVLDVGTTTAAVARALVARADLTDVVVITNGLNIALEFEAAMPRFTVIVTGGTLRPLQHSLVDPFAGLVVDQLYADVMFLGCNGIHPEAGVTNVNVPEAEVKRRMMRSAERTAAVADGSKVGSRSVARICPLEALDLLITGPSAPPSAVADLDAAGLEVEVAAL
jgi:DeoR family transcriptional regulator of aga operon